MSWELREYYIRIVKNNASGLPDTFNVAWAIGSSPALHSKSPRGLS